MKEYLEKQADGSYKLVMRGVAGKDDDIEVPEGAEIAVKFKNDIDEHGVIFYKNNGKSSFSEKIKFWEHDSNWTMRELLDENHFYDDIDLSHRILWQRHVQPEELPFVDSINDQYAEIEQVRQGGMKFDSDKPRYSLLPKGAINSVIKVLEFGAKKYDADNWQKVDNAEERYYNAAMRHIDSWWNGEKCDPETGIHHLAHAATNLFFLMWFDNK